MSSPMFLSISFLFMAFFHVVPTSACCCCDCCCCCNNQQQQMMNINGTVIPMGGGGGCGCGGGDGGTAALLALLLGRRRRRDVAAPANAIPNPQSPHPNGLPHFSTLPTPRPVVPIPGRKCINCEPGRNCTNCECPSPSPSPLPLPDGKTVIPIPMMAPLKEQYGGGGNQLFGGANEAEIQSRAQQPHQPVNPRFLAIPSPQWKSNKIFKLR